MTSAAERWRGWGSRAFNFGGGSIEPPKIGGGGGWEKGCSFSDFWVWVTSEAGESVSVGFWRYCQLSPFGGGSSQGALSTPPLPHLKVRLPLGTCASWPVALYPRHEGW